MIIIVKPLVLLFQNWNKESNQPNSGWSIFIVNKPDNINIFTPLDVKLVKLEHARKQVKRQGDKRIQIFNRTHKV